jgi:hypothetical protein
MTLKLSYTMTGTDDPAYQMSKNEWNGITVSADTNGLDLPAGAAPAAPAAGNIRLYGKNRAGRIMLNAVGPSGVDYAIQPSFVGQQIMIWGPNTGTTVAVAIGTAWTARNSGTGAAQSTPTPAMTSAITRLARANFGTGTTTTGASGTQSAQFVHRGASAGVGGFFFASRFAAETYASDVRMFFGLSANNATMAAQPSTWNNTIGIGKDSGDTTWQLICRDGATTTKVNTGETIAAGNIYDLYMWSAPNGSVIGVRFVNAITGAVIIDNIDYSTNIPANNVALYAQAHIQATTGTTAKTIALNRIYVESDI